MWGWFQVDSPSSLRSDEQVLFSLPLGCLQRCSIMCSSHRKMASPKTLEVAPGGMTVGPLTSEYGSEEVRKGKRAEALSSSSGCWSSGQVHVRHTGGMRSALAAMSMLQSVVGGGTSFVLTGSEGWLPKIGPAVFIGGGSCEVHL